MKLPCHHLIAFCCLALLSGCGPSPEVSAGGEYNEEEMQAAIAGAREHIGVLTAAIASGETENFAVKVAVSEDDKTEHFWITDATYADGKFTGKLGANPELLSHVKAGDEVSAAEGEISDWFYVVDDKMHGNYTLRVMLPGMNPTEAVRWRQRLAPLPE